MRLLFPPFGLIIGFLAGHGFAVSADLLVLFVGIAGVYGAVFMAGMVKATAASPSLKRQLLRLHLGHR